MNEYEIGRCKVFDENYKKVLERLNCAVQKAGKSLDNVTLLAATKTVEPAVITHAFNSGIKYMGENRVQEFLSKEDELPQDMHKQFIGTLQTNKVKQIVGKVELIQSVDSIKLANEISRQSIMRNITTDVLVEINIGNEWTKSGIDVNELDNFLEELAKISNIKVKGLMTLGPVGAEIPKKIEIFTKMHKLFVDNRAKKSDNIFMDILSMGMSDDFDLAVEHGSNMVRVGTALFGHRNY